MERIAGTNDLHPVKIVLKLSYSFYFGDGGWERRYL
jgi:hypothetical protein